MRFGDGLLLAARTRPAADPPPPGPPPTTWNPADKSARVALTNGNRTATGDGAAFTSARGTQARADKRDFEAVGVTNYGAAGLADAAADLEVSYNETGPHAVLLAWHGNVMFDGAAVAAVSGGLAAWDVCGFACDLAAGRVWFSVNGVWSGDPAAGAGGVATPGMTAYFPMVNTREIAVTANFGSAAFVHAPPAGFIPWDA